MELLGEAFALLVAVSWTTSNFYFQAKKGLFSPIMLTFIKCTTSTAVILVALIVCDINLFPVSDASPYIRLIVSGFLGITFGDALFVAALDELGARKVLMIETLAPPLTGMVAYIYYGTTISFLGWIGIALILSGLYVAVVQTNEESMKDQVASEMLLVRTSEDLNSCALKEEEEENTSKSSKNTRNISFIQSICSKGMICGASAMMFHSVGIVLASSVYTSKQFNPLLATFIRICPQNFVLYPVLKYYKKETFKWPLHSSTDNYQLFTAVFFNAFIVIWFTQLSLVYTRPEITQTLIATSPLFGVLISRLKGESITAKQVLGSFVSVFGVILIVLV